VGSGLENREAEMREYDYSRQSDDYLRIEKAIQFIEDNFKARPTLEEIAQSVHLSKYRQRL